MDAWGDFSALGWKTDFFADGLAPSWRDHYNRGPMIRRLDRYVLLEISGPLALGFLIFTFIFLINFLFKSADLIIRSKVPADVIGKLLLLSLPSIIVLTIPIAFLFSVVIAVGRLSADSELTAIRASGVSLFSLYRPILALSAILSSLCVYLMLDVLPKGNNALQQMRLQIMTRSLSQEIQPRVPHTDWGGKVLYIFEAPSEDSRWHGVFLADAVPSLGPNDVVIAEWGEAQALDDGHRVLLQMSQVYNHQVDFSQPVRYNIGSHEESFIVLDTQATPVAAASSVKRGLREIPFDELLAKIRDPDSGQDVRYLALIEVHRKFSFPAACLVFGLFALPLGIGNARGGRSSGFALSFVVILGYYVLLSWGEDLARNGTLPIWLASWLANMVFLAVGLFLLARRNADKSMMLSRLRRWIQHHLWPQWLGWRRKRETQRERRRERQAAARPQADLVLRVPDLRLRFPSSMDRYILSTYIRVLIIATMAGLTLYIVADVTERIDSILQNNISADVVIRYYQFKSFTIFYQIAPFITLVTTLLCFGLLSRSNELTAFKASGVSLYRLAVPVVLASACVAGVTGWLQADLLAAANAQVAELEGVIRNRPLQRFQRADRRWLYGKGEEPDTHYLYNYLDYNEADRELYRLQVFKFDRQYRMTDRLLVNRATYVEDGWWTFSDGWARSFDGTQDTYTSFKEPVRDRLPEPPDFFRGDVRSPDEMTYRELREYVHDLREIGAKDVPPLEVQLHNKIAYPAISLVMALVGLPFAFRMGRQGALYGVGLALVLGIVLMIILAFFTALGEATVLPPAVAVWSPSVLFAIFSLYLFLGVRT